ncbi:hypothetical protein C0581_00525 [Candidatus Parcubacteria bacterium]|nr:MAG: hypothetical protein C0581_00525 [Candidatus Parcubacteria bacterium]
MSRTTHRASAGAVQVLDPVLLGDEARHDSVAVEDGVEIGSRTSLVEHLAVAADDRLESDEEVVSVDELHARLEDARHDACAVVGLVLPAVGLVESGDLNFDSAVFRSHVGQG